MTLKKPPNLDLIFEYQPPDDDQQRNYVAIRAAAKVFAKIMLANTPLCPDQDAALRLLRECVMTANAAVALRGNG